MLCIKFKFIHALVLLVHSFIGTSHRIGQTRPVTVYRFVMKNSIEEKIVDLHRQKKSLADSLLAGEEMGNRLSSTELIELMKESLNVTM